MSQASNQVQWCLNKAKKEIEECEKENKRIKHRGLLQDEPGIDNAKKHLKKAERNLKAITDFKKIGYSDWSVTAAFYSIYQCFLAIASKFGYESRNQQCTIALMRTLNEEDKIELEERFIEMLEYEEDKDQEESTIGLREEYTYGIKVSIEDEKINTLLKDCQDAVDVAKEIVFSQDGQKGL